jgi:hypothetical protein
LSFKYTFILITVLVFFGAYVLFFGAPKPVDDGYETPPEVWSLTEEDIERISLSLPKDKIEASFVIGEDGYWDFDEPERNAVDLKRWGGIVLLMTGPQSRRLIAEKISDLSQFGLDSPNMIITIGVKGVEASPEIHVGSPNPNGDAYYVKLKSRDPLYTLDKSWYDVMKRLASVPPRTPVKPVSVKQ